MLDLTRRYALAAVVVSALLTSDVLHEVEPPRDSTNSSVTADGTVQWTLNWWHYN